MSMQTAPAPQRGTDTLLDADHLYCCNPSVALCGEDISWMEDIDFDEALTCPLCEVLDATPCPRCGE